MTNFLFQFSTGPQTVKGILIYREQYAFCGSWIFGLRGIKVILGSLLYTSLGSALCCQGDLSSCKAHFTMIQLPELYGPVHKNNLTRVTTLPAYCSAIFCM